MRKSIFFAGLALAALMVPAFAALNSGLEKGKTVPAFHPRHVVGPLKGTTACPPCTFGNRPMVQVWVNSDNMKNAATIAENLEKAVADYKGKEFKAFVIFIKPANVSEEDFAKQLEKIGTEKKLDKVALAYLNSPKDDAVKAYEINTASDVKNTIFVYRNKKVAEKFVNFDANSKNLVALNTAIKKIVE